MRCFLFLILSIDLPIFILSFVTFAICSRIMCGLFFSSFSSKMQKLQYAPIQLSRTVFDLSKLVLRFRPPSFTSFTSRTSFRFHSLILMNSPTVVRVFSSAIDIDMTSSVCICKIRSINCFNTSSNQLLAFYIETHFYSVYE